MEKEKTNFLDENKSKIVSWSLYGLFMAIGVAIVLLAILRQYIFPSDSILYNLYSEDYSDKIAVKLIKTVVIVAACLIVSQIGKWVAVLGTKVNNNTAKTALLLVGNVDKYLAFIFILLLGLAAWGVDTTAIVTGAGVLTLVISLGCQSMVSDIVAGIFMLFEGDIRVGDVVVVNGWRGTVQQIGLRRTRIIDAAGNVNIINNSSISNIINNTEELSIAAIEACIDYDESIERVETILKDAFPQMKKDIPAIVEGPFYKGVSALAESSVNLKIVAKVKEGDKYQTERDLNRAIKLLFDKEHISIPFNQLVVDYRNSTASTEATSAKEAREAKKFVDKQKELSQGLEEQH